MGCSIHLTVYLISVECYLASYWLSDKRPPHLHCRITVVTRVSCFLRGKGCLTFLFRNSGKIHLTFHLLSGTGYLALCQVSGKRCLTSCCFCGERWYDSLACQSFGGKANWVSYSLAMCKFVILCLCACVCVLYMCICACMYVFVCTCVCMYVCMCVHLQYVSVCVCLCMLVSLFYVCVSMFVCNYVWASVHLDDESLWLTNRTNLDDRKHSSRQRTMDEVKEVGSNSAESPEPSGRRAGTTPEPVPRTDLVNCTTVVAKSPSTVPGSTWWH